MLAVTAAFAILLSAYSVIVPLTEAPDEPQHADLIFHLADGGSYPAFDERRISVAAMELCAARSSRTSSCPQIDAKRSVDFRPHRAEDAPPKNELKTFDEWGGNDPVGPLSEITQHPPLYYLIFAGVLRVLRWVTPGISSFESELAVLRLVNVSLVMWLPLLVWRAARELGVATATAKIASAAPLAVPQLVHIGSTVNNDNLLILLAAITFVLLARVLRGDRRLRTALLLGTVVSAAVLAKVLAVMFVPAICLAYWLSRQQSGAENEARGARMRPAAVAVGTIGIGAGWWFVRNIVSAGSAAPTAADLRLTSDLQPPGFVPSVIDYVPMFVPRFLRRFWGQFGWYSAGLPPRLSYVASALLFALVVIAVLVVVRPDQPARDRGIARGLRGRDLVVLLAPILLLTAFVGQHAWALHAETSRTPFIQGRYVFAGIVGLSVVAAVGTRRVAGRWSAVSVAGFVLVMHLFALRAIFSIYWFAPSPEASIRAAFAWSPWPNWMLWLGCIAVVASVGWFLVEVRRESARFGSRTDRGRVAHYP